MNKEPKIEVNIFSQKQILPKYSRRLPSCSLFSERLINNVIKLDQSGGPGGGEDGMTEELTKQVCCIKYSLMACNAFGIMLGKLFCSNYFGCFN